MPTVEALASLTHAARTGDVRGALGSFDANSLRPIITTPEAIINAAAPKLSLEEEIYALSLVDLVGESLGMDVRAVVAGDVVTDPQGLLRVVMQFASSGQGQELLSQVQQQSPQAASAIKRLLNVNSSSSRSSRSSSSSPRTSSSGVEEEKEREKEGLDVLTSALEGLNAQEREILGAAFDDVLLQLRTSLVARLSKL